MHPTTVKTKEGPDANDEPKGRTAESAELLQLRKVPLLADEKQRRQAEMGQPTAAIVTDILAGTQYS